MSEQESSRNLLEQLKLTKQQIIEKEQERQRRAEAERKERERLARLEAQRPSGAPAKPADTSGITVRKVGSSYQDVDITHLKGNKVKAPLDIFKITKKFGTYDDPVYNIKIHNDSVTLKTDSRDSVVRAVLGGKVIFAKDYNVLGKTVVIEHSGNILTFYSNLSQIAPGIVPGKKINARTAVGRVEEELKFKVTKGTTLVDPLELIRI
jgi:murein DD-endopeptidase MepM/ murein hydrolase activator NlpD